MDDEELLRQMLLQSMQASSTNENNEPSIQPNKQSEDVLKNTNINDDAMENGAREEGEISDEEGAVTPERAHLADLPRDTTNENSAADCGRNYVSIDSDDDDYSKRLKNYEKKLDPESDTKDDERRGGRRSPRARRGFSNAMERRRDRNTRRSDRYVGCCTPESWYYRADN